MTHEQLIKTLKGIQYIVINTCHGGFGLSEKAVTLYKEMAGITDSNWHDREVARDDPYLVKIVQDLKEDSHGRYMEWNGSLKSIGPGDDITSCKRRMDSYAKNISTTLAI